MIYLNTSFLAPFYIREATSDRVEAVILGTLANQLAISDWTRVEFASLLARRMRMGELTQAMVEEVMRAFEVDAEESYVVFAVNRADFDRAIEVLLEANTGLRAGDALHLSIAYNRRTRNLLTLDQGLLAAANVLGMKASSGGMNEENGS